jgi:hypothetical protein
MERILEILKSIKWLQIIISVVIFMLGLFAQPMLDTRVKPLFTSANIPLTIFLLVTICFAVIIAIWSNMQRQISSISDHTDKLAKYVGQRAQVLSHVAGYEAVRTRTQGAQSEILKLIYYEVDSEDGYPVYDTSLLQSPERKAIYQQEREKLQHEKGKDTFRYAEIVQIPYGCNLEKIFYRDPIYKESCEFLAELGRIQPEFASLRTSEVIFPNTFIIIDRSFLYIAFQTKNPDTGSVSEYPFLGLMIEDPDSQVVRDMVKLYQRIEASSTLLTRTNIKGIANVKD